MGLSTSSLRQLSNQMADDYIKQVYESEELTELLMEQADKFLSTIELEEESRYEIALMLLESVRLSAWKD